MPKAKVTKHRRHQQSEEQDDPFGPDPDPTPPTKGQLKCIMNSYIILGHERSTRVNSKEEASAIISDIVGEVRAARGGMKVPRDEYEGLVFDILWSSYGLRPR